MTAGDMIASVFAGNRHGEVRRKGRVGKRGDQVVEGRKVEFVAGMNEQGIVLGMRIGVLDQDVEDQRFQEGNARGGRRPY